MNDEQPGHTFVFFFNTLIVSISSFLHLCSSFFDFDSDKFWKIMRKWSEDNIVVVSEYKAPKDFKMIWQSKTNVMHNGKKNIKTEKLFVYNDLYENMDAQLKRDIKKI